MIDAKHAVRGSGLPGEERPDRFGDDPTDSALREPQVHIQNTRHQYNLPAFDKPIHRPQGLQIVVPLLEQKRARKTL